MEIERIVPRKILDSRGNITVEVEVFTGGRKVTAQAPSGASTGSHEVVAFPKNIDKGIETFKKEAIPKLVGCDIRDQAKIDQMLKDIDGTERLERFGGNVVTATSMACARAASIMLGVPLYRYINGLLPIERLPYPFGNVIGGGVHAHGGTDVQEILAVSISKNATENVFANALVHRTVGKMLRDTFPAHIIGHGDEGAWIAPLNNLEAIDMVARGCEIVSKETGVPIRPALDYASSELYKNGTYVYKEAKRTTAQQIDFVENLAEEYDMFSVEDPFFEDDFASFTELTERIGKRTLVLGDDLFVTNTERLKKGIAKGAANAIIIKVNQVGTLTDALACAREAHANGYKCVVSHRSGETPDDFITHLAVGISALGIKTGVVGGERIAKLNELIRIQEGLHASS
jgi:enolase